MVKISDILNPSILNSEWVGFQGDSEYQDANGDWHLGYWSFVGITEDSKGEIPWNLDDEVPENAIYVNDLTFVVKNNKDHICLVKFHYRRD